MEALESLVEYLALLQSLNELLLELLKDTLKALKLLPLQFMND